MKQKNLILVAVAVGCGLVAAVLTSQIGAKPAKAEDQVEIPVAAKDLTVGSKLSKDDLKNLVTYKKFNKDALPAAYAGTEEELADKRIIRTVRAGEPFNPQDLTTNVSIAPPKGKNVITFQVDPVKGVAGFAGPGSKVDVLASVMLRKQNKAVVFPLLTDMLVLAIDSSTQLPQAGQAFANMSMASLAVNNKEATLLHAAINRGADIRLVLRNVEDPAKWEKVPTEDEIWKILADETEKEGEGSADENGKKGGKGEAQRDVVQLPVPTEDLPAGTKLTDDLIESKFKLVEFTPPAPANVVQNLKEHAGKYLQQGLAANQFVPKGWIGDKPTAKEPPKSEPETRIAPKDPKEYWDTTVQTSQGYKTYRYEKLKTGEYKFLGELKDDGSVQDVPNPNGSAPAKPGKAAPAEGTEDKPGDDKKPADDRKPGEKVARA